MVIGVVNDETDIGSNISYLAGGRPVPKRIDPSEVYDRVFGELILPYYAYASASILDQRDHQLIILDFLNAQLESIARSLQKA